ncbi:DUF1802 family protein [Paenibacillus sp. TRM 82003]|nr:DUF1802 family protein [Paenibacillus sp. TRM 82003]
MTNNRQGAALKEWASAIEAFLKGETILALRKGGIREETRDFALTSEAFYFFPTYEHQKEHLLKEPYRRYAAETKDAWDPAATHVTVRAWAEATEDILIGDEELLSRLSPYHIWSDDYAGERLHWKRTKPLHCLLLRVYRLEEPLTIENVPAFAGCKSWIELPAGAGNSAMEPVLSDEAYQAETERIKRALNGG